MRRKISRVMTREVCPADIPDGLKEAMQQAALKIHNRLQLGYYSESILKPIRAEIFIVGSNTHCRV